MAEFFFDRIGGDINRIDEVPAYWREEVRAMCEAKYMA